MVGVRHKAWLLAYTWQWWWLWRWGCPEVKKCWCPPLSVSILVETVTCWTWPLLIQLNELDTECQGPPVCLSRTGIADACMLPHLVFLKKDWFSFYMCMSVLFAHLDLHFVCIWSPQIPEEGTWYPGTGVSCHVGARSQTWILFKSSQVLNYWAISSASTLHFRFILCVCVCICLHVDMCTTCVFCAWGD